MPDALALAAALLLACAGLGWFALSLAAHWGQVCDGRRLSPRAPRVLRAAGALALLASLLFCLRVDHASIAALVWTMLLAASALAVAFLLAWRPRWLRVLARIADASAKGH